MVTLVHVMTVPQSLGFLTGQVGYMKMQGFEVHGISSPGAQLQEFSQREQIPVYAVDMSRRVTPVQDLHALVQMHRCLRGLRPQIVHAHTPKGGLLGMLGARVARVPVRVYHMRGLPFVTAVGGKRAVLRLTEKISCTIANQVFCVSPSVRAVAVAEGICPADKITVLGGGSGNGVDAQTRFNPRSIGVDMRGTIREKYGIPRDAVVVGFVGRIVRDKGISELVEAWVKLRAEFPTVHLLIVGPFEPQDPVPAAVEQELRGDPRVHLTGEEWHTPPLYAAMDLVVLPTYREGFPNVPLEAAAMALPVVATRIPGCVDAVHEGKTGMLVPVRDAHALAAVLSLYLSDPALREQHGKAGRERVVREFAQETIWQALYQEYVGLLRSHQLPVPRPVPHFQDIAA